MRALLIILISPFVVISSNTRLQAEILLEDIHVVAGGNGKSFMAKAPIEAIIDDTVWLYPVIKANVDGEECFFGECELFRLNGREIPKGSIRKWNEEAHGALALTWFRIIPERYSYMNDLPKGIIDSIGYEEVRFSPTSQWEHVLTGKPGTFRFRIEARYGEQVVASAGIENWTREGLLPDVLRISMRENKGNGDNVDYMTLFFGLPYIWGNTRSQVERSVGADCQDLVWFGLKRAGLVPQAQYDTHIHNVYRNKRIFDGFLDEDGTMSDAGNEPVVLEIKRGDVIRLAEFGHYGAIYRDCSAPTFFERLAGKHGKPNGILDGYDLVIHILFDEPKIETLERIVAKYYDNHIQVFRF